MLNKKEICDILHAEREESESLATVVVDAGVAVDADVAVDVDVDDAAAPVFACCAAAADAAANAALLEPHPVIALAEESK